MDAKKPARGGLDRCCYVSADRWAQKPKGFYADRQVFQAQKLARRQTREGNAPYYLTSFSRFKSSTDQPISAIRQRAIVTCDAR